ncbi:glutaredoxin family protein [Tessaracoccus sp. OS52]|uniref:glutaredoxin family protein n=1 Tax=Tessaracoccus sp. OS52 TaxID=2886691 RepID=UPI001D12A99E|nr:glutaredoxin family protein [Tessaracoccus sp. OS52]MCC2594649.1 glutaredoxin family protein [Tessaracoccus sp. OS52]
MPAPSRVLLLTRPGCHLCEEAESVVAAICEEVGAGWRKVDVDSDDALRAQWTDHVPVTFADQSLHGRWFVDPDKLRQALLDGAPHPMPADWRPPAPGPS